MNSGYLYFLLPLILFPTVSIINVLFGRKIGARKLSLYRQITITVVGSPIILSLLSKGELLKEYWIIIFFMGLAGASYLTIAFHAMNLTSIGLSRSFVAISRTISSFLIGYFLFQDAISAFDLMGVGVIFLGFFFLSRAQGEKFHKNDIAGIIVSLVAGIIFSTNTLLFKLFAQDFSAIEAAYILEASSMIFLVILTLFSRKDNLKQAFYIDRKRLGIMFLIAPLVLLASYGLAKSVNEIPFYIFNTLFILVLIVSMILSWIFLHEKFNIKQLASIAMMMIGCVIIVLL